MKKTGSNRRTFLSQSGSAMAGGWLSNLLPVISATALTACAKREEGGDFVSFDNLDAKDIEAITEQILPSDETPGARDAGVIWFIDASLSGFRKNAAEEIENGLRELNSALSDGKRFADLPWEQQTMMLKDRDQTGFFNSLRFLTVAGMFSMPSEGGNREKLGWALIGRFQIWSLLHDHDIKPSH